MTLIVGKYQHYRNEDIEDFLSALGVSYVGRKIIKIFASPSLQIMLNGDVMTLNITASYFASIENTFKLGQEYYEQMMPTSTVKSITTVVNDQEFVTHSVIQDTGDKCVRHYYFTEDELVITYTHDKAAKTGKRYFRRENLCDCDLWKRP